MNQTNQTIVQNFLKHHTLADNSRDSYGRNLRLFAEFLEPQGKQLDRFDLEDITAWVNDQRGRRHPRTISVRLSVLRALVVFLRDMGMDTIPEDVPGNRAFRVPLTRKSVVAAPFTKEQFLGVLRTLPETMLTEQAIGYVILETGMSVHILIDLQQQDFDVATGTLRWKYRQQLRETTLSWEAQQSLRKHLQRQSLKILTSDPSMFLSYRKRRYTRQGIWKMLARLSQGTSCQSVLNPRNIVHAHRERRGHGETAIRPS